ncbi:hypothetical protein [Nocardioides astragali]|uniref:Lipoprotein n=1 Tax=Nocardioides astragali TaxID=1776736 RepID=A0ABW2MVW6_9ACTN|nr:hypothetical protein [Nocardioides astragali]
MNPQPERRLRTGLRRSAITAAAVTAIVGTAGCSPAPEDPDDGELTGVVVNGRSDTFVFGGGGESDTYDRILVMTPTEVLDAYHRTWPGQEDPEEHEYRGIRLKVAVSELQQLEEGGAAPSAPAVAPVDGGYFRIPWSAGDRYLCLGMEVVIEAVDTVDTAGCVLVDQTPPASVTIELNFGGPAIKE